MFSSFRWTGFLIVFLNFVCILYVAPSLLGLWGKSETEFVSRAKHEARGAVDKFVALARTNETTACTEARYQHIKKLATLLGYAAHNIDPSFTDSGKWGIFASKYKGVKTRFIFDALCSFPHSRPLQVCEVGFNAGQSAVLFLNAFDNVKVLSWDLGDISWSLGQANTVKLAYGDRFDIIWGSSLDTVAPYFEAHPEFKCDVAFIDGIKQREGRLLDLQNFRKGSMVSKTMLLFDEVTSMDCVKKAICGPITWEGATLSYYDAITAGLISVDNCDWPAGMQDVDGVCRGSYTQ